MENLEKPKELEKLKEAVLKHIWEYGEICGNACGLTAVSLIHRMRDEGVKISFSGMKQILNDLFVEKKIVVRDGMHGKLVFYNYARKEEVQGSK